MIGDVAFSGQDTAATIRPLASVGIFWGVPGREGSLALVTDRTILREAEEYGDFLTHPRGHYEVWEAWRQLGPAGLVHRRLPTAILRHEYEECPRGRIVYSRSTAAFVVYADRRLQRPNIVSEVVETFGLPGGRFTTASDAHYR